MYTRAKANPVPDQSSPFNTSPFLPLHSWAFRRVPTQSHASRACHSSPYRGVPTPADPFLRGRAFPVLSACVPLYACHTMRVTANLAWGRNAVPIPSCHTNARRCDPALSLPAQPCRP